MCSFFSPQLCFWGFYSTQEKLNEISSEIYVVFKVKYLLFLLGSNYNWILCPDFTKRSNTGIFSYENLPS